MFGFVCNQQTVFFLSISDKEKANEDQAEGPLRKQFKAQYFDDWEKELCLWKAKMNEIAQPEVEDSKILPNDYDKWLTPEQTEFVESAIDHETWLSESKNFRMMVQMVLQCQQRLNYLKSYYDRILTQIIERKVLQYFTDNYSLARIITENQK